MKIFFKDLFNFLVGKMSQSTSLSIPAVDIFARLTLPGASAGSVVTMTRGTGARTRGIHVPRHVQSGAHVTVPCVTRPWAGSGGGHVICPDQSGASNSSSCQRRRLDSDHLAIKRPWLFPWPSFVTGSNGPQCYSWGGVRQFYGWLDLRYYSALWASLGVDLDKTPGGYFLDILCCK